MVTNTGNQTITGGSLADPLLTGNLSGPVESVSANGDLDVGENWTYTGTYTVTQADVDGTGNCVNGSIDNTATYSSTELDDINDSASVPCGTEPSATIVKTVTDVGGDGPGGLANEAGDVITYSIVVTNTSTGVPSGAEVADSLLVSLGFNLVDGVVIVSGNSAVIGASSIGLGAWASLGAGDSVADQWLWTNDGGGDLLESFSQVISTSMGQGGGDTVSFNGVASPNVGGPFGGIAATPPIINVPAMQPAVSNSIEYQLTLSAVLSHAQLQQIANGSIVEYGSDYQYLVVPTPGSLSLLVIASIVARTRRRTRPRPRTWRKVAALYWRSQRPLDAGMVG